MDIVLGNIPAILSGISGTVFMITFCKTMDRKINTSYGMKLDYSMIKFHNFN